MSEINFKIVKILISFLVTATLLIYYHVQDEDKSRLIRELFNNKVFRIDGVSTQLTVYDERDSGIFIKLEAIGLPEDATNYKPLLLSFICSKPFFQQKLIAGKSIVLDMSAPDRENGNYVNMNINKRRCGFDF